MKKSQLKQLIKECIEEQKLLQRRTEKKRLADLSEVYSKELKRLAKIEFDVE